MARAVMPELRQHPRAFSFHAWQPIPATEPRALEPRVLACIAYGAEMSRERCVDIPMGSYQ